MGGRSLLDPLAAASAKRLISKEVHKGSQVDREPVVGSDTLHLHIKAHHVERLSRGLGRLRVGEQRSNLLVGRPLHLNTQAPPPHHCCGAGTREQMEYTVNIHGTK